MMNTSEQMPIKKSQETLESKNLAEQQKSFELPPLTSDEVFYLDFLSSSIANIEDTYSMGAYVKRLPESIVEVIADQNSEKALQAILYEPQIRLHVLAKLAVRALNAGRQDDVQVILKHISEHVEQFNHNHRAWRAYPNDSQPFLSFRLLKASQELKNLSPSLAGLCQNLSEEVASSEDRKPLLDVQAKTNPEVLLSYRGIKDSGEAEPVKTAVQSLLRENKIADAFEIALSSKQDQEIIQTGTLLASFMPDQTLSNLRKIISKMRPDYQPPSSTIRSETAQFIRVVSSISTNLFHSGNEAIAKKYLEEASIALTDLHPGPLVKNKDNWTLQEYNSKYELWKYATDAIISATAAYDINEAVQKLDQRFLETGSIESDSKTLTDESSYTTFEKERLKNRIAANGARRSPKQALEIYLSTKEYSQAKKDALISLLTLTADSFTPEEEKSLLSNLDEYQVRDNPPIPTTSSDDVLTLSDLEKLAEVHPTKALELLRKIPIIVESPFQYKEVISPDKLRTVFSILQRNNFSLREQAEFLKHFAPSTRSAVRAEFEGLLLQNNLPESKTLLQPDRLLAYVQNLDLSKKNDLEALENLYVTDLLPSDDPESLLKQPDTLSQAMGTLLLGRSLFKKPNFDTHSLSQLFELANTQESFVRTIAQRMIQMQMPHFVSTFYSNQPNELALLLQLPKISPEIQAWCAETLDKEIQESLANHTTSDLILLIPKLGSKEFKDLFPETIEHATKLVIEELASDEDLADYYLENLHLYVDQPWAEEGLLQAVEHYSVAQKFIQAVHSGSAPWKDASFIQSALKQAKLTKPIQEDDDFEGERTDGFLDHDPYEEHPYVFTAHQAQLATTLGKIMQGVATGKTDENLQLSPEAITLLQKIEHLLTTELDTFFKQLSQDPKFPKEDLEALIQPENVTLPMTPLKDTLRQLLARYLIQRANGSTQKLEAKLKGSLQNELQELLQQGFEKYLKVYEIDIPLYDKLYAEFDLLREAGRYPMEIYLGRDGIYAWIGRRAQDHARRRSMGLRQRQRLKESGELLEIHPKYLIYPRYFRDNLSYETKRAFLEQEGVSPEVDPMFFDTGYTGTIPEQIMKVMDFDKEEIDRRIRLLSAQTATRRVKGVSENARSNIIEGIEHNAKVQRPSTGLFKDPETGRIRPVAEPTDPREQFYFMLIKQAISRHYWLKEQVYFRPVEQLNRDAEQYRIRIRNEFANLLPDTFLQNPQTYLQQYGELLKGSLGEGEFPDEEITLFHLKDGTEVVAKRVELRKAKEAKKEYSILLAAQKALLPTAKAVGFLEGKSEEAGSYLLMEKIDGLSGRNIDKTLRAMGTFSEEHIQDILRTIADKNKAVAELFRQTLHIDKRWRIKDTIIQLNEQTGLVTSVIPIDWERVENYDPKNPQEIDEV